MRVSNLSTLLVLFIDLFCASAFAEGHHVQEAKQASTIDHIIKVLRKAGFEPVVLHGKDKKKVVVVTPDLVGRVLCVGFDGLEGRTESYVCEDQIQKGLGPGWSNFGGEQRIWIAPESGAFGLFITSDIQTIDHYKVPKPLSTTRFGVVARPDDSKSVTSSATMSLVNRIGTEFKIRIKQGVEILRSCPYSMGFSNEVDVVGFETHTSIENVGPASWTKETGPLSIWTIGQFPSRQGTVALMPFRPGPVSELGEPVVTEYFRLLTPDGKPTPSEYWPVKDDVVMMRADGSVHTKLEISAMRALGRLASINIHDASMTIVDYDVHAEMEYVNSYPLPYEGGPYNGGAMSTMLVGKAFADPPFHELESCSPALFLRPGEKYCHTSRTYHLKGEKKALAKICERHFHVDMKTLVELGNK